MAKRRAATAKAQGRVDAARAGLSEDLIELADLEDELAAEIVAIADEASEKAVSLEVVEIPLEKTDITVADKKLVWIPR